MLKKILCFFFGALLVFFSLVCLFAFIVGVAAPSLPKEINPNPYPLGGYVVNWIAIIGFGLGAFSLLRAGVRAVRADRSAREDNDDDEEDESDYGDE